jgi:hypothetical protein
MDHCPNGLSVIISAVPREKKVDKSIRYKDIDLKFFTDRDHRIFHQINPKTQHENRQQKLVITS